MKIALKKPDAAKTRQLFNRAHADAMKASVVEMARRRPFSLSRAEAEQMASKVTPVIMRHQF